MLVAVLCAGGAGAGPYRAPRTAYGQPDLQGFWTNATLTDLERATGTPLTWPTRAQEAGFEQREMAARAKAESGGLGQGASE